MMVSLAFFGAAVAVPVDAQEPEEPGPTDLIEVFEAPDDLAQISGATRVSSTIGVALITVMISWCFLRRLRRWTCTGLGHDRFTFAYPKTSGPVF